MSSTKQLMAFARRHRRALVVDITPDGAYHARFDNCEIRVGKYMLTSFSGFGWDTQSALNDYARRIDGKLLVFHALSDQLRREIRAELTPPLDFAELEAQAIGRVYFQVCAAVKRAKQNIALDFCAAQVENQRAYTRLDEKRQQAFGALPKCKWVPHPMWAQP